jgi:hypothetical protein
MKPGRRRKARQSDGGGRLRIGDDWNAITIIALSQDNPLKAVAELVENSIDAGARNVTITRGRRGGEQYLTVSDDGEGVRRNKAGEPDFHYVATHICDSIKRRLRAEGAHGIQGEFGIGLLSFWTVGEHLAMSSSGADGRTYEMRMRKGDPSYAVVRRRILHAEPGTLPGQLNTVPCPRSTRPARFVTSNLLSVVRESCRAGAVTRPATTWTCAREAVARDA